MLEWVNAEGRLVVTSVIEALGGGMACSYTITKTIIGNSELAHVQHYPIA